MAEQIQTWDTTNAAWPPPHTVWTVPRHPDVTPAVIRVLLAVEPRLFRRALMALLEPEADLVVAGEVDAAACLLPVALSLRPDVLLLDADLPGLVAAQMLPQLQRYLPATHILLLGGSAVDAAALTAVRGQVTRAANSRAVAQALRAAHRDGPPLAVVPSEPRGLRAAVAPEAAPPPAALTSEEVAILRLVAQGSHNRAVAEALGLSESRVKKALSAVLRKWQLSDRTQAVVCAIQQGFISPPVLPE